MYLLLLIVGTLALATACGLLLAGAKRLRKTRKSSLASAMYAHHIVTALPPPALSPLARHHAIRSYQAIQALDVSDEEPALPRHQEQQVRQPAHASGHKPVTNRRNPSATPNIALVKWRQQQPVTPLR